MSFCLDYSLFSIIWGDEVLDPSPIDKTIEGFATDFQLSVQVIKSDVLCVVTRVKRVVDCICVEIFAFEHSIFKEILTLHKFHFSLKHKAEFFKLRVKFLPLFVGLEGLHEIVFLTMLYIGLLVHVVELEGALYRRKCFLVSSRVMEHNC